MKHVECRDPLDLGSVGVESSPNSLSLGFEALFHRRSALARSTKGGADDRVCHDREIGELGTQFVVQALLLHCVTNRDDRQILEAACEVPRFLEPEGQGQGW